MASLPKPDILAELTFFPSEKGGRRGPTPSDAFGCPVGFEGQNFDIRFDLSPVGQVSPGSTVHVKGQFLSPHLIKPRLKVGSTFTLWELGTIGEGRVLELYEDN